MQTHRGLVAVLAIVCLAAGGIAGFLIAPHVSDGTSLDRLTIGERYRGELTTEAPMNAKDGSRYQKLRVTLPADEIAIFSLEAPFQGELTLYDNDREVVARSQNSNWMGSNGDVVAEVSHRSDEQAGYTLVASGTDINSYGPFSIDARTVNVDGTSTVTPGSDIEGWLQGDGETFSLEIEESGLYIVAMDSQSFDTYLELSGNGVNMEDDDGGEGTNSRLQAVLDPGSYEITTRSYSGSGAAGLFNLSVASESLPGDGTLRSDGPVEAGETVSGLLQGNSAEYTLTVEETGLYSFAAESESFDTTIQVEGNDMSLSDDDGGNGTNSLLEAPLEAGEYRVRVESYGNGSGLFTLDVGREALEGELDFRNGGEVGTDSRIRGMLQGGQSNDYTLTVEEAGPYTIDLRSSSFDTYLELDGEEVSHANDDGGSGTNARLQVTLPAGEYRLRVRDVYDSGSGMYDLEIR